MFSEGALWETFEGFILSREQAPSDEASSDKPLSQEDKGDTNKRHVVLVERSESECEVVPDTLDAMELTTPTAPAEGGLRSGRSVDKHDDSHSAPTPCEGAICVEIPRPQRREKRDRLVLHDEVEKTVCREISEVRRRMLSDNDTTASEESHRAEKERIRRRLWFLLVLTGAICLMLGALGFTVFGNDNDDVAQDGPPLAPTGPPSATTTESPATVAFSEVVLVVESVFGISVEDPSSPQYRAAEWIANVDQVLDIKDADTDSLKQRYALAVFYFATGGDVSWIQQTLFLSPDLHECDWKGAYPPGALTPTGVIGVTRCTNKQRVSSIDLANNNLSGTIPMEIVALSDLVILNLAKNDIEGWLPPSLFSLSNLQILSVAHNEITGTVPEANFQLLELAYLDMSENRLHGVLPFSFPSRWPNLIHFSVSSNRLSGTLPEDIDSLSLLQTFSAQRNILQGRLPQSLASMHSLTTLLLGQNELTGSVPNDRSGMSAKLSRLSLKDNQLKGKLPESLGELTALTRIDLSGNHFEGTIPTAFGNLAGNLTHLLLQDNELSGTLPTTFSLLKNLQYLALSGNNLVGDMSFLCVGTEPLLPDLDVLAADCIEEVVCTCCLTCCDAQSFCFN